MILLNIKNRSDITVFNDGNVVYKMVRNSPLFSLTTYGEIFEGEKIKGKISLGMFLKKKILAQSFLDKVEIIKQQLYVADFLIDENQIRIKNNPFFSSIKSFFLRFILNLS